MKSVKGTIKVTAKAVGYVAVEGMEEDVEIQPQFLKTALNGDEVEISLKTLIAGIRQQGEVVNILKRAKMDFVGVIDKVENGFFLVADDKRLYRDIFISPENALNAQHDEKVFVKIIEWKVDQKSPQGKVTKVLGKKGEHNVEMQSIVLEKGFENDFPPEIEKEAEKVAKKEKARFEDEISLRKDFRETTTFTIDPVDAKDFDDAISLKNLPNGDYEIGIHIADVSHFVTEGSVLDKEARKRGFSVYLVDRTIPMLPEVLSNDMCSLNPQEDKLAFSSVFVINKKGEVKDRWFGKTVINSNKRFSYEEAQSVINAKSGQYFDDLNILNTIAKIFQEERYANGAIDFETEEVRFELDADGVPLRVYKKSRLDTHKLVEEFMLLANREVAEFIFKANNRKGENGKAFIYRIHDEPNKEKIADLVTFLRALGHDLTVKNGNVSSKDIGVMLKRIVGSPAEFLIKTATIRSMAKAVYSTNNIGHFGLGFEYYTHFTSPIRRYPDLIVHRLLQRQIISGKIEQDEFAKYKKIAMESSDREISAAEAERASIKYKQVEYMMKHIGEEFEGIISGVTEWGIYVEEIETKCEGMVKTRDMKDDTYELDAKNYALVGANTKKRYSLGDRIKFKITNADLDRKILDFALV